MPRFKIAGSYGFIGTNWEEEVEAETPEDAEEMAQDRAMEKVEFWVEEIKEEDKTDGQS